MWVLCCCCDIVILKCFIELWGFAAACYRFWTKYFSEMVKCLKFHQNWFGSLWLFLHEILLLSVSKLPSLFYNITYAIWWTPTLLHHESMHLLARTASFPNQTSNLGSGGVESFCMSCRIMTAKENTDFLGECVLDDVQYIWILL